MICIRIGILSIGNEIVKGRTVNTNASDISSFLTNSGYEISYVLACRDIKEEIGNSLEFLVKKCDIIITTGGLGPTVDDITVESIALYLKLELVINEHAYSEISTKLTKRGMEFTPERLKMALMPAGSEILHNTVGTAPGMILKHDGKIIFSIPGVPSEMRAMLPGISSFLGPSGMEYYSLEYDLKGLLESKIAPYVKELIKKYNYEMLVKTHPESGNTLNRKVTIEIYGYGKSKKRLETLAQEIKEEIDNIILTKL